VLHLGVMYGHDILSASAPTILYDADNLNSHTQAKKTLKSLTLEPWSSDDVSNHYAQMCNNVNGFEDIMKLPYLNSIRTDDVAITQEEQSYPTVQHILDTVKRIAVACGCPTTGTRGTAWSTSCDFCLSTTETSPVQLRGLLEVKLAQNLFVDVECRDIVLLYRDGNTAVKHAMDQAVGYCVTAGVKYCMIFADDTSYIFYVTLSGCNVTAHVSPRIDRANVIKSIFHLFLCSGSEDWPLSDWSLSKR
jgi:hypothetical protein